MSSFPKYQSLWPNASWPQIKPLFDRVHVCESISEHQNRARSILIVDRAEPLQLVEYTKAGFDCIIQRSRPDFAFEFLAGLLLLNRPASFVSNPIPFFVRDLGVKTIDVEPTNHVLDFRESGDKNTLLAQIQKDLERAPSHLQESAVIVADELITNALFHAPLADNGRRLFENLPRSTTVIMPSEKPCTFFFKISSKQIVIGVRDSYGSILRPKILDRLRDLHTGSEPLPVAEERMGAGLGLKMVLDRSSSLYIFQQSGTCAVVAAQIDLVRKRRSAERTPKNLLVSFDAVDVTAKT